LKDVVECEAFEKDHSPGAFRIIPTELALYRRLQVPLPRKSPSARYFDLLSFNNPLKLWHRQCMCEKGSHGHEGMCPNEFETAYSPATSFLVFCESCYQKEVM
jgi:hypothetical protein